MSFSNSTLHKMARALTPQICDEIFKSDEYVVMMQNLIPTLIHKLFDGKISVELVSELSFIIFDNINIEPFEQ